MFTTLKIGDLVLKNRVVLAPLTRSRCQEDYVPTDVMVEHYRQRASAGLLISEGTLVSKQATGWWGAPAIYEG